MVWIYKQFLLMQVNQTDNQYYTKGGKSSWTQIEPRVLTFCKGKGIQQYQGGRIHSERNI